MSDKYSWCHGTNCHKRETQDRVRGVKGSKVIRTRKVRWYRSDYESKWNYFCSNTCLNDYLDKHLQALIRIEPRPEPLETPCEVIETKQQGRKYDWETKDYVDYIYTEKKISIDYPNG
jgi:YHS domain-containing protein